MPSDPFSSRPRGFHFGDLPGGYGFAFNYEEPAGVKLLNPILYSEIKSGQNFDNIALLNQPMARAIDKLKHNPHSSPSPKRLNVWLHIVNGCNFSCRYCYIPQLNRNVERHEIEKYSLKSDNVFPLLNNLIAYCREHEISRLHLIFAGGEPTLNLSLVEHFCSEATKENHRIQITFGMISNGSFQFEALFPLIRRYKIKISLSVDGFEDSHDQIRFEIENGQKKGSWRLISKNIDLMLREETPPFLLYTVTPDNYKSIFKFASWAHEKKLGFRFSLIRGRSIIEPAIQEAISDELSQLYFHLGETLDVALPIIRNAAFSGWNLYRKKFIPCSTCRNYFAIGNNGGVATCQMQMNKPYGNAITEQFSEIVSRIKGDLRNQILANPYSKQGVCTGCEYFHVCAGGCPQHTLQATGSMDNQSPWCRVYGMFLPDYIRAIARQLQRQVLAVAA